MLLLSFRDPCTQLFQAPHPGGYRIELIEAGAG
jgi:hypothetical protein